MADYIAQMRSNYFQVKNAKQFQAFCQQYHLEVITEDDKAPADNQRYGCMVEGSIPTGRYQTNGNWIETDFLRELSRHLVKGEVAILMEVGSEKMRYLIGYACAVNAAGQFIEISLTEIYSQAERTFGVAPSRAEY